MPSSSWLNSLWQKPVGPALAWAASVVLLFHRLPFGISYADEASYSAIPYSFAIGGRPYVDELGVFQNVGILLTPFFRAYIAIAGSGDGLVLFNRYLYFVCVVAVSVLAFRFVKRVVSTGTACWVGGLIVTFAYFGILSISYNSCGAFGFLCGMAVAGRALLSPRPGLGLFGATLLCVVAMFGYPGLTPVVALYLMTVVGWLYWMTPRASFSNGLLGLCAGVGVALLAGATFVIRVGFENVVHVAEFTRNMGYAKQGALQRLNVFGSMFEHWGFRPLAYLALYVALPLACRFLKSTFLLVAAAAATAVALAYCYWLCLSVFTSSPVAIGLLTIPMLAPVCFALNPGWKYGRFMLLLFWLPSTLSMVAVCYSSANSYFNAYTGSLGALLAGVVSFAALVETMVERAPELRLGYQAMLLAFTASLLINQNRALYAVVYAEEPRMDLLTTRVHSGPFRGTKTSAEGATFLETIDRDLKTVERENPAAKTLTVFDNFPGGYMSTRLKPRTFSNWIIWGFFVPERARALAQETFGSPDQLPDILLEVTKDGLGLSYWEQYVHGQYKPIIRRPDLKYAILKKIHKHAARK